MSESFEEIAENFAFLDEWEDRYRYVIDLGKGMQPLADALKVPAAKVDGCASQVWLIPRVEGCGEDARFYFEGDSDALIVRGLIAILRAYYSGRHLSEVAGLDVHGALSQLGLDQHLSAQRSNGLRSMIARIRGLGERLVAA